MTERVVSSTTFSWDCSGGFQVYTVEHVKYFDNAEIISKMEELAEVLCWDTARFNADSLRFALYYLLFGENVDFEKAMEDLALLNDASVCAKVFQRGEAAYFCDDCGFDPTCIQCLTCFKASNHEGHSVRMSRAGGGGCCDCGDASSWNPQGFCSKHSGRDVEPVPLSDAFESFSLKNHENTVAIIETLVRIFVLSVCSNTAPFLMFPTIEPRVSPSQGADLEYAHCLFLHNDDTHSFNQVIEAVMAATRCSEHEALSVALRIDRFGKCLVFASRDRDRAENAASQFERIHLGFSIDPIARDFAHPSSFVIHKSRLIVITQFLYEISARSDVLRAVVSNAFFQKLDGSCLGSVYREIDCPRDITALDVWMISSCTMDEDISNSTQVLFFQLFKSLTFKRTFTVHLLTNYSLLMDHQEHIYSLPNTSVLDFVVQLFTIPDIVTDLSNDYQRYGLQASILEILIHEFAKNIEKSLNVTGTRTLRRFPATIPDIGHHITYCLRIPYHMVRYGHSVLTKWLFVLSIIEPMHLQRQKRGVHVSMDMEEWRDAFILEAVIGGISDAFLDYLKYMHLEEVSQVMSQCMEGLKLRYIVLSQNEEPLDISVSFHIPLMRFVCTAVLRTHNIDAFRQCAFKEMLLLRLTNLFAAVIRMSCGMWVRNGLSIGSQLLNYKAHSFTEHMYQADIRIAQFILLIMDPDEFIHHLCLSLFLGPALSISSPTDPDLTRPRQIFCITKMLHIISTVLSSNSYYDELEETLSYELIQWFLVSDMTFSEISDRVSCFESQKGFQTILETVLERIAVYHPPSALSSGKFILKPEYVSQFDPSFSKIDDSQLSQAETNFFSKLKNTSNDSVLHTDIAFPPIPCVNRLQKEFRTVFESRTLGIVIRNVFQSDDLLTSRSVLWSLKILSIGPLVCEGGRFIAFINRDSPSILDSLCKYRNGFPGNSRDQNKGLSALVEWILEQVAKEDEMSRYKINSTKKDVGQKKYRKKRQKMKTKVMKQMEQQRQRFLSKTEIEEQKDAWEDISCIICKNSLQQDKQEMGLIGRICASSTSRIFMKPKYRCQRDELSILHNSVRHCGHYMHISCLDPFVADLLHRSLNHREYDGFGVISVPDNEFLCPFCKSLSNCLIPLFPLQADPPSYIIEPQNWQGALDMVRNLRLCEKHSTARADMIMEFFNRLQRQINLNTDSRKHKLSFCLSSVLWHRIESLEVSLRPCDPISMSIDEFIASTPNRTLEEIRQVFVSLIGTVLTQGTLVKIEHDVMEAILNEQFGTLDPPMPYIVFTCFMYSLAQSASKSIEQSEIVVCLTDPFESPFTMQVIQMMYQRHIEISGNHPARIVALLKQILILRMLFIQASPISTSHSHLISQMEQLLNLRPYSQFITQSISSPYIDDGQRPSLIDLPHSYADLFELSQNGRCDNCGLRDHSIALCLLCGRLLCFIGPCNAKKDGSLCTHSEGSHDRVGLFLHLRRSTVLMIRDGFGIEYESPYLDSHGEADESLIRGRPLYLNKMRWEKLLNIFLTENVAKEVSQRRIYVQMRLQRNLW